MVLRVAVIGLSAAVLAGCINSGTLVKVKPDGSGTIEQTMLVNAAALKGLMSGFGGQAQVKEAPGAMNEEEFKRTAERMGVRPVSLTPMKENGFEGSKAIFAFDDITKIRVDQDPPAVPGAAASAGSKPSGGSPIKFGFARQGASSVLTITVDEKSMTAGSSPTPTGKPGIEKMDPAMLQMIKTMFQGFKVQIDLEVDGKIIKTDADYVTGSRVTLLELDMATLFENEAALTALQSKVGPGASIADVRPYLKDVKGVKINNPSLTIEFR